MKLTNLILIRINLKGQVPRVKLFFSPILIHWECEKELIKQTYQMKHELAPTIVVWNREQKSEWQFQLNEMKSRTKNSFENN